MVQPDLSVKPELATSWEANEGLASYTFHLRQGVKFHHGKDFKAEDVLFSFNRLLHSAARQLFRDIVDIVALDEYTVRFDLEGPNTFFLDALSSEMARILLADVDVDRLTLEGFGTGPFMIDEHLPGERTTMVRNPDYWEEGKPYLDEIVILLIPEVSTRTTALKSGEVDIVYQLAPQSAPGIEAHPDTVVLQVDSPSIMALEIYLTVPPFDNKLVRQAMQAATDRESIVQAATLGRGTVAYDHPVLPSDPLFAPQYATLVNYDPDLARSLLEQAGYPDGIDITLHSGDIGPGMIEMALAFKQSAEPAGIRVEVSRVPADAYFTTVYGVEPFTQGIWWGPGQSGPHPERSVAERVHLESVVRQRDA